ncbi:SigE family RNA polymerase sigma factor [Actinocrinis sp.]|uniref:SigE family RNA polymerase sigma factor n=1 Tax=Actinocrinis sp. TaxID=1920516 RepID=UPI002BBF3EDD|nr:SigE family RNA polymerase sigma factor [Actinocrinis sp.]HXR73163.1 SigE family RNA polymerase sigma factor [Actinocrinis sp.]
MDARARTEFEEFVTARSAALFRTAVLLTGNRQDAQDLVQSALERACRHWDKVAAAEQPEAYVRRILVNSLKDRWRIRKRIVEVPFDDARPSASIGQSPNRQVEQVELRRSMIAELLRLPIGIRAVLVLRYFEDLSEADIAHTLGCSTGTVKSQAARGLAKLRAALGTEPDFATSGSPPANQDTNSVNRLLPNRLADRGDS